MKNENEQQLLKRLRLSASDLFIIAILIFLVGFGFGTKKESVLDTLRPIFGLESNQSIDWSVLDRLYAQIKTDYDGKIESKEVTEGAMKGLVDGLGDPHSYYMSSKEAKQFDEALTGDIGGGIGAEIGIRNDNITIVRPLKNNPAARAGILAGDVILKVDDENVIGQKLELVIEKIRGKEGTAVKLNLMREGVENPFDVSIVRSIVDNPSVEFSQNNQIGILTISRFDQDTANLAQKAARDFIIPNKLKGVIVDLRDNSGGILGSAQNLSGLWLSGQAMVIEKRNDVKIDSLKAPIGQDLLKDTPTVILVNEGSASASEIIVGALKDYKKAIVIGEKTYGKGSVQQLLDFPNGGQLKLTVAHWFTPKGLTIDKVGIKPDIEVKQTYQDVIDNKDPQLERALAELS